MTRKKVGNYYLVSQLGKGQFGTVYKGVCCENPNGVFAIKCIAKDMIEKDPYVHKLFQTEVEVMSKINSTNILHLFEFIETANNYYLVIQYCNNGDLEKYLQNVGRLPEEQAVYFLMQIMNGFQVLLSHKVMHRDFKLANVFLHEDTVIIGDFGFAKKGVDVTKTKLGTPITMAPEMLLGNGGEYTNKADLWSIGIVFYQLLFGRIPFDVRNYDELKEKVQTQSGPNLRFPADVPISSEAKQLLKSLLQPNPKNRLEWSAFFAHKLFENGRETPQPPSARKLDVLNQSLFQRQNQERVTKEFARNKEQPLRPRTPEKMIVRPRQAREDVADPKELQHIVTAQSLEKACDRAKLRYFNEKKKVIFLMFTVRKLRNLSKQPRLVPLSERMMAVATLLLHKATLYNDEALAGLRTGENSYNLPHLKSFVKTESGRKILENFLEDQKIYDAFKVQIRGKFEQEVSTVELRRESERARGFGLPDIAALNAMLWPHLLVLIERSRQAEQTPEQADETLLVLLHVYYSLMAEKTFQPGPDEVFEWKSFEAKLTALDARGVLLSLK